MKIIQMKKNFMKNNQEYIHYNMYHNKNNLNFLKNKFKMNFQNQNKNNNKIKIYFLEWIRKKKQQKWKYQNNVYK